VPGRLAGLDNQARLLPVGMCALLFAAILVSALPPSRAVTSSGMWSHYGSGPSSGGPAGSQTPEAALTLVPDLAIQNVLAEPVGGWPRSGFTSYMTKNGDSLAGIAAGFGLSVATLYFANQALLPDPAVVKAGLQLRIPPIDGAIVVVADGQTLMEIANEYHISGQSLMAANALTGPDLKVGQMLVVPGAYPGNLPGAPGTNGGTKYVGGSFWWPVFGPWRFTQGFWGEHRAIDIAAPTGTPVVAAAGGRVVYAGWRSETQGGNVVWIQHNGGLYTTYNHLSKWSVRWGQTVKAGQKVGEIGTSGVSSGPHLHFEVWRGYPWHDTTNNSAINPCHYLVQC
jgi:murein DD-endopeptidase MepM/ murein hydrolase activator NlpD